MKYGIHGFMTLMILLMAGFAAVAEDASLVDQYKQERLAKRAYERFLYAQENLLQSTDVGVINEAVQDAVRYATEDQKALQAIESALTRLPADGDDYREAVLARGKMLARLGQKADAETLFQNAIANHWQHAMWRYSESLIENDEMVEACILECQRIAGLEKYANYRGEEESLEIFLTLLRLTKADEPDLSVAKEVSQHLESIADKSVFMRIAQALCIAEDGYIPEAITLLDQIDQELSETKEHREYKHIPLYKASILFKDGSDYPAAQTAFTAFMQRNEGKNSKIIASALRLARDIEIRLEDRAKMDELAIFVINTEWFQSEEVQKELTDDDKAGIYDMQQKGYAWSGDFDTSVKISRIVAEKYPNTLAGQNCLTNCALYLGYHDGNQAESIRMLNEIVEKLDNETLIAHIRVTLAEEAMKQHDYNSALIQLQDALDHMSLREKGAHAQYRQEIEAKIQQVIRLKAGIK